MNGRRSALAVGLVIAPAVALPAALALLETPFAAQRLPDGALATQAVSLALAALFLAPLPRPAAGRFATLIETVAVAALSAGALAAAAVFSGSPRPGAETAAATAVAASAFLLGRLASLRGGGAVARHAALAFGAVFAAPFAGYALADFGAPAAAGAATWLRDVNPLRALPPWEGAGASWLALCLPLALALSLSFPARPRPASAAGVLVALGLALAAGPAATALAAPSIELDLVFDAPARPGEWVAVRCSGAAHVSIGGGARVVPRAARAPTLVPVGPFGAAAIAASESAGASADSSFPGPGHAAPGDVRVGLVEPAGVALPNAERPARLARVGAADLAAAGAEGLSVFDALVLPRGGSGLGAGERAALVRFADRGGVLVVPEGDALLSRAGGLGLVTAFPPGGAESAVSLAVAAALSLRPTLEPGAVDPDLAPVAAAWRTAAESGPVRAYATLAWVFALAIVLGLATRAASGLGLVAVAAILAAGAAGAAVRLRGPATDAIGFATRVAFAGARGGAARVETWLALASLGRSPARFEETAAAAPRLFREVAPIEVAAAGAAIGPDGALSAAIARGASRVFVGEGDGVLEGGVGADLASGTLRNGTGSDLLDVRLVRGGTVAGSIEKLAPGESRAFGRAAAGAGAAAEAATLRWLVARAARGGGAWVVARRPGAGGAPEEAPGIAAPRWEWLVLRVD